MEAKEIEINGCISSDDGSLLDLDFVLDEFIAFVEAHGWSFGGGFMPYTEEDYD